MGYPVRRKNRWLLATLTMIRTHHDPHSGVVDAGQTRVSGGWLAKVFTWFDNEWGFASRIPDVAAVMTY